MKIYQEVNADNIQLWGEGYKTTLSLTDREINTILDLLEDVYPNGINLTDLNDFFAYKRDTIASWLGYESWETLETEEGL